MPESVRKKIAKHYSRATLMPDTVNEEERTVEVVWSTGARVLRKPLFGDPFYEELSMEPGAIRMERLENGAPVFDNHNRRRGTKGQMGVVERVWLEAGKGHAVLRFSKKDEADELFSDVLDGIVRNVSVGYRTWKLEKIEDGEDDIPVMRATDWEPYEISFAPVQADLDAQVRADETDSNEVEIINLEKRSKPMNEKQKNRLKALLSKRSLSEAEQTELDGLRSKAEEAGVDVEALKAEAQTRSNGDEGEQRNGTEITNNGVDEGRVREMATEASQEAIQAERERSSQIREAVRNAGLEEEFADELVNQGRSVDEARAAIIDKWGEQDPHNGSRNTIEVGADERDKKRSVMEDALFLRAQPDADLEQERVSDAREFRGMSLLDLARENLRIANVNTRGMSKREIAETALGVRASGMHSTSDFPILLGNTINRTLRRAYELAPRTFQPFCRQTTASDFREIIRTQIGEDFDLDKIKEGGEYKYGAMSEAKEAYSVDKFGKIIAVTWETLINDDLDALTRRPQMIANKAAQKQSDIVWGIILNNPSMNDSNNLFSEAHNNVADSGAAINIDSLGAARAAMRKQKSLGDDFLNLSPAYLMVGPDKEQEALQFLTNSYQPNEGAKVNVWQGSMEPIVEPRLTGNQWYAAASPNQIDTIEYAFLAGEEPLFTEQRQGFEVDGLEVKVRMVFGAGAIDWRGLYKNPGA